MALRRFSIQPKFSYSSLAATFGRLQHHTGGAAVLVKVVEHFHGTLKLVSPLVDPKQFQGSYFYSRNTISLLDFRLIEIDRGYQLEEPNLVLKKKKLKKVLLFYDLGLLALFPEPGVNDRRRIVDMKVYKLDEDWGTWVAVKSLEDRAFVLGKEVCVSVSVKDFPGCQGNCIYFIDTSDPKPESHNLGEAIKRFFGRVFRFDNGSIQVVECFPAYKRLFSPDMNWPFAISS